MRKLFGFALAMAVIFALACPVLAGGVGTSIPAADVNGTKVSAGVEGNFIMDGKLHKNGDMTGGKIKESNQVYARLDVQPNNYFDAYLTMGTANLEEEIKWTNGRKQTIKYEYGLLLGGGLNLLYDFKNNFGLGWDNQLSWWKTDADSISGDNGPSFTSKGSVNNYNFQSTVYINYKMALGSESVLIPYAGPCYSYYKSRIDKSIKLNDNAYTYEYGDTKNKNNVGIVAGLNYQYAKHLLLNLEGRFISETAVTAGATYKF